MEQTGLVAQLDDVSETKRVKALQELASSIKNNNGSLLVGNVQDFFLSLRRSLSEHSSPVCVEAVRVIGELAPDAGPDLETYLGIILPSLVSALGAREVTTQREVMRIFRQLATYTSIAPSALLGLLQYGVESDDAVLQRNAVALIGSAYLSIVEGDSLGSTLQALCSAARDGGDDIVLLARSALKKLFRVYAKRFGHYAINSIAAEMEDSLLSLYEDVVAEAISAEMNDEHEEDGDERHLSSRGLVASLSRAQGREGDCTARKQDADEKRFSHLSDDENTIYKSEETANGSRHGGEERWRDENSSESSACESSDQESSRALMESPKSESTRASFVPIAHTTDGVIEHAYDAHGSPPSLLAEAQRPAVPPGASNTMHQRTTQLTSVPCVPARPQRQETSPTSLVGSRDGEKRTNAPRLSWKSLHELTDMYEVHISCLVRCDCFEHYAANGRPQRSLARKPVTGKCCSDDLASAIPFARSGIVSTLLDSGDWRARAQAVGMLEEDIKSVQDPGVLSSCLDPLMQLIVLLLDDANFKIELTALRTASLLIRSVGADCQPFLSELLPALLRKFGDNKIVVRETTLHAVLDLAHSVPVASVLRVLAEAMESATSWRVREEISRVCILLICTRPDLPAKVDIMVLGQLLASGLDDDRDRVRYISAELFRLAAEVYGAQRSVAALEQTGGSADALSLANGRLAHSAAPPTLNTSGEIEFYFPFEEFVGREGRPDSAVSEYGSDVLRPGSVGNNRRRPSSIQGARSVSMPSARNGLPWQAAHGGAGTPPALNDNHDSFFPPSTPTRASEILGPEGLGEEMYPKSGSRGGSSVPPRGPHSSGGAANPPSASSRARVRQAASGVPETTIAEAPHIVGERVRIGRSALSNSSGRQETDPDGARAKHRLWLPKSSGGAAGRADEHSPAQEARRKHSNAEAGGTGVASDPQSVGQDVNTYGDHGWSNAAVPRRPPSAGRRYKPPARSAEAEPQPAPSLPLPQSPTGRQPQWAGGSFQRVMVRSPVRPAFREAEQVPEFEGGRFLAANATVSTDGKAQRMETIPTSDGDGEAILGNHVRSNDSSVHGGPFATSNALRSSKEATSRSSRAVAASERGSSGGDALTSGKAAASSAVRGTASDFRRRSESHQSGRYRLQHVPVESEAIEHSVHSSDSLSDRSHGSVGSDSLGDGSPSRRRSRARAARSASASSESGLRSLMESSAHPVAIAGDDALSPRNNPSTALREALSNLDGVEDWAAHVRALDDIRALARHHADVLLSAVHECALKVLVLVDSLRSSTSRAAIMCVEELFRSMGDAMDSEVQFLVPSLLKKAGLGAGFLIESADNALLAAAVHVPGSKLLSALAAGASHRSAQVRFKAIVFLSKTCDTLWYHLSSRDLEKVLPLLAALLSDGNGGTRHAVKRLLCALGSRKDENFQRIARKVLSERAFRDISDVIAHGAAGIPDPVETLGRARSETAPSVPRSAHSRLERAGGEELPRRRGGLARTQRAYSASAADQAELRGLAKLGSESAGGAASAVRPGRRSSSGARSQLRLSSAPSARPVSAEDTARVESLLAKLDSDDWSTRLQAVTDLCSGIRSRSVALDVRRSALVDSFAARLKDVNAKVSLAALREARDVLVPLMGDSVVGLVEVVNTLASVLASSNAAIRSAADAALDEVADGMAGQALFQALLQAAVHGPQRSRAGLLAVGCKVLTAAFAAKPHAAAKRVVAASVALAKEARGELRSTLTALFQGARNTDHAAVDDAVRDLSAANQKLVRALAS